MGPAFFPQSYVNENFPLAYFRIKEDLNWMRCVAYLKGTYITTPERRLFELWKQVISSPSIIMVYMVLSSKSAAHRGRFSPVGTVLYRREPSPKASMAKKYGT